MQFLDATTLLLVNALFNLFAAAGWSLLAGVFRVAPRASWMLAGAHLARIAAVRCGDCRVISPLQAWPALPELMSLLSLALLCLGVRQLLRLRFRWGDVAIIMGIASLATLLLSGQPAWMLLAGSLGLVLLALLICRDILIGARPLLSDNLLALLVLPYVILVPALAWRAWRPFQLADPTSQSPLFLGLWLLLSLASALSLMALILSRLIQRITHLSLHDPLTGALNRRALTRQLHRLQSLALRGHPFSVVLLDIDHFKSINDQHGHAGGDAALVHLVRELDQELRQPDLLGRLGGEEFCVLLPHASLDEAAEVAERLRARLAARPCRWRGGEIALSASFGVAGARAGELRAEAVLVLADQLLYRAKALGRNKVCVEGRDEGEEPS
ncbi:GGDEF domain-containing protein [Pelomonas sp. SE-A7]|uniref:GGDEF domain-containing protein n=1 Tax=Pelomonas sp. SE-A7 TaxID=3054953 RepID=UPI00259C9D53|nr:GGDEF domain-containing protein [Pelomonas sp. SE-A7]MDM4768354.1 GGDEF domain-containing protein [Pelomonas sp. SE-A7]